MPSLKALLKRFVGIFLSIMMLNLVALTGHALEDTYSAHQLKLVAMMAKVRAKEESIQGLLAEKSHVKNVAQLNELASQLAVEHKELRTLVDEYEKERNIVRYRYPEMNSDEERKYRRMTIKSIEDIESEMGLDKQLDETKKKVRTHYGLFKENPASSHEIKIVEEAEESGPHSAQKNNRTPAQESRSSPGPIILVK